MAIGSRCNTLNTLCLVPTAGKLTGRTTIIVPYLLESRKFLRPLASDTTLRPRFRFTQGSHIFMIIWERAGTTSLTHLIFLVLLTILSIVIYINLSAFALFNFLVIIVIIVVIALLSAEAEIRER